MTGALSLQRMQSKEKTATMTAMTTTEKYAAIVALLKDERGNWREEVSGADFVQEVSLIIDAPDAPPPVAPLSAAAETNEHPWCRWVLAFADGSDWDTPSHYGFGALFQRQFRLTTADGRSRPVELLNTQYIDDANACGSECDRRAGIEVVELETENYEPMPGREPERIPYEDIREVVVF